MTISQKRAIGYNIRYQQKKRDIAFLKSIGKYDDFVNSKYKYISNYIKFAIDKH